MSQTLIGHYLSELARLRQASGSRRESVLREAFKDLLKAWGRQHDLVFVPEYELDTAPRERRSVDGALRHALRVPFGYWEAKDEADDLDAEIALKFKRGYPQDNIVFEDSTQAVLIQHREEVMRCGVADVADRAEYATNAWAEGTPSGTVAANLQPLTPAQKHAKPSMRTSENQGDFSKSFEEVRESPRFELFSPAHGRLSTIDA